MNWMPIETAPKDGSRILLGKLEEGQWYWIVSGEFMNDGRFWCDWEDDDDYDLVFYRSPTHWSGLPINPISPHPTVESPTNE
jgi:hypothetical protein